MDVIFNFKTLELMCLNWIQNLTLFQLRHIVDMLSKEEMLEVEKNIEILLNQSRKKTEAAASSTSTPTKNWKTIFFLIWSLKNELQKVVVRQDRFYNKYLVCL